MEVMTIVAALSLSLVLQDCPDRPNCVSSQASDPKRLVQALHGVVHQDWTVDEAVDFLDKGPTPGA